MPKIPIKRNNTFLIPDARTHALHCMCPKLPRCIAARVRETALEEAQKYIHAYKTTLRVIRRLGEGRVNDDWTPCNV